MSKKHHPRTGKKLHNATPPPTSSRLPPAGASTSNTPLRNASEPPKRVSVRFAGILVSVHEILLEEMWGKDWKQKIKEMDKQNMDLARVCFLRDNPQARDFPAICDRTLLTENDDKLCEEIKKTPTLAVLGLDQMYALARWTYVANWGTSEDAKDRAEHLLSQLRPTTKGRPQKLATVDPVVLKRSYERLKEYFGCFCKALRDPARKEKNAKMAPRFRRELRDATGAFNPTLEFPEYKYLFDDGIFTWDQVDGTATPLSPSGMAIQFLCSQYGGSRSALLAKLKLTKS